MSHTELAKTIDDAFEQRDAIGPHAAIGREAWLAGIRDWNHGWLKVLKTSGDHLKDVMKKDLGTEVEVYEPEL